MTGHLPDCFLSEPWNATTNPQVCICHRLRACEQRVLEDEFSYKGDIDTAYGQGWDAALNAAREAVTGVGVRKDTSHDMRVQALAAIDALRGES